MPKIERWTLKRGRREGKWIIRIEWKTRGFKKIDKKAKGKQSVRKKKKQKGKS